MHTRTIILHNIIKYKKEFFRWNTFLLHGGIQVSPGTDNYNDIRNEYRVYSYYTQ